MKLAVNQIYSQHNDILINNLPEKYNYRNPATPVKLRKFGQKFLLEEMRLSSPPKSYTSFFSQVLFKARSIVISLQDMVKLILVCLFLLSTVNAICQPFGRRIFYGNNIKNATVDEKLVIHFNTRQLCNSSYATIIQASKTMMIPCNTVTITASSKMNYTTYIHVCRTNVITYQVQFFYNIYGWDGSMNSSAVNDTFIRTKLIDPYNQDFFDTQNGKNLTLIVLADWSYIEVDPVTFKPIKDLLIWIQQHQINGLVILGDVIYEFDSSNGTKYEKFLNFLNETVPAVPLIHVTGNHEHKSADDLLLAMNTFQQYGKDVELAVSLKLGSLNLVPFDPYLVMYKKVIPANDSTIGKFKQVLNATTSPKFFTLPCSHYPYICSGPQHCLEDNSAAIKPYFDAMLDNGVSLYMSGHEHLYQRMFPYLRNGSFWRKRNNYRSDGGYLIALIEGVGGSDIDIVQSIVKQDYTVNYRINQTGFGVLSINSSQVSYIHLSWNNVTRDRFFITRI